MSDYLSAQLTNTDAVPAVMTQPNERGKLRCLYFNYIIPVGDLAIAKTLELVRLRKGARILGGHFSNTALSTGGGTAKAAIGDGTTANKFKAATTVDAASSFDFATTPAENCGLALTQDTSIIATVDTEAWVAAGEIRGYVLFLGD